jgi:hypothetical protein
LRRRWQCRIMGLVLKIHGFYITHPLGLAMGKR